VQSERSLRRVLRKPAVSTLLESQLARLGPDHAITDIRGRVLLGNLSTSDDPSYVIRAGDHAIGHAHGPNGAQIANIINALVALEAETRAVANESLERYKELTMLYDVSERIIGAPDPTSVAASVADEAKRFLKCDSVAVLLLNEETGFLELVANRGIAFHTRASLPVEDDLIGSIVSSGNGEIVNDLRADPRSLRAENVLHSIVCSPLRAKDKVIGVVVAGSEASRHFNAGDLQLLNAMTAQAATAIEVAHLDRALQAASDKPPDLIYAVDDRPSTGIALVLGLQHVFIAILSLTYPVLITLHAGGSRLEAASIVSVSLIAMAIATALQVNRAGPIGAGFLAPHITSAIFLGPSLLAARIGGLSLVFGMTLLAGAIGLVLSPLLRRFRKLFPPEVSGVVVLMVGLSMVPIGMTRLIGLGDGDITSEPTEWGLGLITLASIVILSVSSFGRLRLYSTALGVAIGYATAFAFGILDGATFEPVRETPLFGAPSLPDSPPTFSALLVLPFLAAALASVVKDAGLIISCQKTNDSRWKRPDTRSVSGGVVAGSVGNIASGLLGGVGLGISAGSIGLSTATGATARTVGYFVAALFLALAFMPKVAAAVALMPSPIMGAGLVYVACHLVTSGAELITSRMLDARRTYVIGLSLVAGVGALAIPQAFEGAPEWLGAIFSNPLALSTTVAIALNLALSAGVSSRAMSRVVMDERLFDSTSRFLELQGAAWGARSDVVKRAAPAITEYCEELRQTLSVLEADITLDFDEFRLTATVTSLGPSEAQPVPDPALTEALKRASKRIENRYDCVIQLLSMGAARFDFEH
jgi:xanthine permease XanP